jgi:probable addiction module antidote protein
MPKRTKSYHAWLVRNLADPHEAERYLKIALQDSPEVFLKSLRNVAEARQMTKIAAETGKNRENLYRALSESGNPRFDTLNAVLDAVGMQFSVSLKKSDSSGQETIAVAEPTMTNTALAGSPVFSSGFASHGDVFIIGIASSQPMPSSANVGLSLLEEEDLTYQGAKDGGLYASARA